MAKAFANYDSIDPLDGRYFDTQVADILSERVAVSYQAKVEAALAQTLADYKVCTRAVANEIERASAKVTVEAVYQEEAKTKHNIKALVNVIKASISPAARPYVHFGATSYDIVSTAQALQYRVAVNQIILPRLKKLLEVLIFKTSQYANAPQIGRTHGQHAVPITFGFAISEYVARLGESTEAIKALANTLVGKFSGATGSYNALSLFVKDPQRFEKTLLSKLQLKPAGHSTQIAPPEPLLRLMDELTLASGIMANLATDMRHLQRSEIAEVREQFETGQTGSSTMAHKRNPVSFENVASLHKQVLGQALAAQLNIVSEHQRDLTDSASSRFYPLLFAAVAQMSKRLASSMDKLEINSQALAKNLSLSGGAIAAEPLYLLLAKAGHPHPHEAAKELAIKSQDLGMDLVTMIKNHPQINNYWNKFSTAEKKIISHPQKHYIGLSAGKAKSIARQWQMQIKRLT